jgi:hypothetical protein
MLMVQQIVHSNDNIARALTSRLDNYKVTSVPGENIETAIGFINALCERLECCDKLPHDIQKMILSIFDSCSVPKFTNHFDILVTMESEKLTDYQGILREGSRVYLQLAHNGEWLPLSKKPSAFTVISSNNENPLPSIIHERTHDRKGNIIDRTCPKPGSSTTRSSKITGNPEHWCQSCNRWGNHSTSDHSDWKSKAKSFGKKKEFKGNANIAVNPISNPTDEPKPIVDVASNSNLAVVDRLLRMEL